MIRLQSEHECGGEQHVEDLRTRSPGGGPGQDAHQGERDTGRRMQSGAPEQQVEDNAPGGHDGGEDDDQ